MPSTPFLDFQRRNSVFFRLLVCFSLAGACAGWCAIARATESEEAIRHGRNGLEQFNAGNWQSALDEFARAETTMHSPVFRLYVARCHKKLGQWQVAKEVYQRLAELSVDDDAPQPWHQAIEDAKSELAALTAEMPTIQLSVEGKPDAVGKLTVTLDGAVIEQSSWGSPMEIAPGDHVCLLSVGSAVLVTKAFSVEPGEHGRVVELRDTTAVPATVTKPSVAKSYPAARPPAQPAVTPAAKHPYRSAGIAALALGTLSLAAGAGSGIWAWRERDELLDRCGGYVCPQVEKASWQRADRAANVATALLIVGGVNLGVGGFLFYFSPSLQRGKNTAGRELFFGVTRGF